MELPVSKHTPKLGALFGAMSLLAVGLAVFGWWRESGFHARGFTDALYEGLKSVEMGESYDHVGAQHGGEIYLEISRFIGVAVAFSAIFLFVRAQVGQSLIKLAARLKSRHVIVVGHGHFADTLSESLACDVIHLTGPGTGPHQKGRLIRLPIYFSQAKTLSDVNVTKASSVVIAPDDDDSAVDLALSTHDLYADVQIYVRLKDYWLSQRVHQLPGAERLRAFSDSGVASREIIRRHPPFLMAQDSGHARIHALLIGDYDWMEALMAEILASACTLTYGRPAFSFVCDGAQAFKDRLKQRYPEIEAAADIAVFEAGGQAPGLALADIAKPAPVTCVYITQSERTQVLSTSLAFKERANKIAGFSAPVFILTNNANGLTRPQPGSRLAPLTLVPFGAPQDFIRAIGLLAREANLAEKEYHEAYLTFAPGSGDASKPWNELKEEYRISNARAVAHIYAKLFEAGFDLRAWMAAHDIWADMPGLAPGEKLCRTPEERTRLAMLEHERWIADRRLNGWSFGVIRDNARKLHPDIKPFADLTPEIQGYDYNFIDLLAQILKTRDDGLRRD